MTRVDNTVRGALSTGAAPIFLTEQQTIREYAAVLSDHDIGAAPVLAGEYLVGMFTERYILRRLVAVGGDADAMRVSDLMTPAPRTVSLETPLVKAFAMMIDGKIRHLPVVDCHGRLVAMLSMRDIPLKHRIMHRQWAAWTNGKDAPTASA